MCFSTLRCIKLFRVVVVDLPNSASFLFLHVTAIICSKSCTLGGAFPGLHAGSCGHMRHPKKSRKLFLLPRVALFPIRFQLQREGLLLSLDCAYHGKKQGCYYWAACAGWLMWKCFSWAAWWVHISALFSKALKHVLNIKCAADWRAWTINMLLEKSLDHTFISLSKSPVISSSLLK